jgi:ferredoxin
MCSSSLPVKATIEFADSYKILVWSESDGCLLDFAEANNLPAISSCRSGYCGACVVELLAGEIIYEQEISVKLGDNEVLLCSAKPATPHIILKL